MIETISNYVQSIFFYMIFTIVVGLITPEKYKKYIDLVLGFILMGILISPLSTVFNKDLNKFYINSYNTNLDLYEKQQNEILMKTYEGKIKIQINELLKNYEVVNINLVINNEEESLGQIKKGRVDREENERKEEERRKGERRKSERGK